MNDACMNKIELDKRSSYTYPDGKSQDVENQMLTLSEYLNQTEAIVRRFAPKQHLTSILANEDAMSHIAYWLVLADCF